MQNSHSFKLHRTLFNLISFGECWQNFLGLNLKGLYLRLEEEKDNFCVLCTDSIKRAYEIRKFHVAGVKRQQRNVQNSVIHVFCCSSSVTIVVGFAIIQK